MSSATPLEKAKESIEEFNMLLVSGENIDPFTSRTKRNELLFNPTDLTNLAVAYLDAVSGKLDDALSYLRLALEVNDVNLAHNYHHVLICTSSYAELREISYKLADKYPSKRFSYSAYSIAYRYGERDNFERYFDQHMRMLSEDEGRSDAMKHRDELLLELDGVYASSKSTQEQFSIMATIIWSVVEDYSAQTGYVSLSGNDSGCYVVDVKNKDSKAIASMNFELADRVCEDSRLDDCNIISRFSSPRTLHTGVSYSVS